VLLGYILSPVPYILMAAGAYRIIIRTALTCLVLCYVMSCINPLCVCVYACGFLTGDRTAEPIRTKLGKQIRLDQLNDSVKAITAASC